MCGSHDRAALRAGTGEELYASQVAARGGDVASRTAGARTALAGANTRSLSWAVSYTHLRAHETVLEIVCRLLLDKKKTTTYENVLAVL